MPLSPQQWDKLTPVATVNVLGGLVNIALTDSAPAAFRQIGIDPAMFAGQMQPFLNALVPLVAEHMTQRMPQNGFAIMATKNNAHVQQIAQHLRGQPVTAGSVGPARNSSAPAPAAAQLPPTNELTPLSDFEG